MVDSLFDRLLQAFSVEFIFTVIFATYFTIRAIEEFRDGKAVPRWAKKTSAMVVGAISFIVFKLTTSVSVETLLASYFSALFFYDYIIKWLLERFNINYKK